MISGKIKNKIFSSNLNESCHKKTLQDKQVGNNSDMINGELFAIADDLFEKNCISNKQHRFLLLKGLS